MAYPSSHSSSHSGGQVHASGQAAAAQNRSLAGLTAPNGSHPRRPFSRGFAEGEHQLEKLEFALAVALTRGDIDRSRQLREAIDALGGNQEEPGT